VTDPRDQPGDDDGPIGIFRSWRSLYISVIVYTIVLIGALYGLTVLFDHTIR